MKILRLRQHLLVARRSRAERSRTPRGYFRALTAKSRGPNKPSRSARRRFQSSCGALSPLVALSVLSRSSRLSRALCSRLSRRSLLSLADFSSRATLCSRAAFCARFSRRSHCLRAALCSRLSPALGRSRAALYRTSFRFLETRSSEIAAGEWGSEAQVGSFVLRAARANESIRGHLQVRPRTAFRRLAARALEEVQDALEISIFVSP